MSIDARFTVRWPTFSLAVDLQLKARGVTVLWGASGSGKTTLLRCIAGLERVKDGHLFVAGECWQDASHFLPVHRRALGYVFQDAHLFPHLSVQGNLDYALKRSRRAPLSEQRRQELLELLAITALLQRQPARLSGGERQRVAIARALLSSPRLLLMDEALAALDREHKREILPYLERLRDELDIPMLYVSHSVEEVSRLADHVVLLDQGRVLAHASLAEISTRLDLPLAQDPDAAVVIATTVGALDTHYHLMRLDFEGGSIHTGLQEALHVGQPVRIAVHARDVSIALTQASDTSVLNRLCARLKDVSPAHYPGQVLLNLQVGDSTLLARISHRSYDELYLQPGQQVWAQIKSVALVT